MKTMTMHKNNPFPVNVVNLATNMGYSISFHEGYRGNLVFNKILCGYDNGKNDYTRNMYALINPIVQENVSIFIGHLELGDDIIHPCVLSDAQFCPHRYPQDEDDFGVIEGYESVRSLCYGELRIDPKANAEDVCLQVVDMLTCINCTSLPRFYISQQPKKYREISQLIKAASRTLASRTLLEQHPNFDKYLRRML